MKYFYIGVFILCLLLGACWFSGREVSRRTQSVTAPLQLALSAVRDGNNDRGLRFAEMAASEWERNEGVLASLLSHNYTNEISSELCMLRRTRDMDFVRVCEHILRAIEELAIMDRPIWHNIL